MHEREWRLKGDFEFELSQAVVLLSNTTSYKLFIQNTDEKFYRNYQESI